MTLLEFLKERKIPYNGGEALIGFGHRLQIHWPWAYYSKISLLNFYECRNWPYAFPELEDIAILAAGTEL